MSGRVLNVGSLNIDRVYRVTHTVRPGETLASTGFQESAGGKGLNQSIAAARAGAGVSHAGRIGEDGRWLIDLLADAGVDTAGVGIGDGPSGHAAIQVSDDGENAIVLFPGENHRLVAQDIETALAAHGAGGVLLLQNEVNDAARWIEAGAAHGLSVWLNPAPMTRAVPGYPLQNIDVLLVNQIEARELVGETDPARALPRLHEAIGGGEVVLTLGAQGVVHSRRADREPLQVPAEKVRPIDTTAAGDTFIGYFLAGRLAGLNDEAALRRGVVAAGRCVTRRGAVDSIPRSDEIDSC